MRTFSVGDGRRTLRYIEIETGETVAVRRKPAAGVFFCVKALMIPERGGR